MAAGKVEDADALVQGEEAQPQVLAVCKREVRVAVGRGGKREW